MTRYPLSARVWTTGPGGVSVSVIPDRPIIHVIGTETRKKPVHSPGTVRNHITAYLTAHGSATAKQMETSSISRTSVSSCLSNHPELFVSRSNAVSFGAPKIWQLRGAP